MATGTTNVGFEEQLWQAADKLRSIGQLQLSLKRKRVSELKTRKSILTNARIKRTESAQKKVL